MDTKVLELLVCPECKEDLQLEILRDDRSSQVIDGILACEGCGRAYPVIDGIPRLLPDEMNGNLLSYHREFFERHGSRFPSIAHKADKSGKTVLKERTLKSFSFQWNTFGKIYLEYGLHWQDYLPVSVEKSALLEGKLGLDAGCGFGRHALQAAAAGAQMIGMDLSEAVKAAYSNTRHLKNVHIIQGDIYNPPFRRGTFDFIYSLGVLHHLPDPDGGFRSLAGLLRQGQEMFIWCYDNEKPKKNSLYEFIRRYSSRLNYKALYAFTFLAASGVRLSLNYPVMLAKAFGAKDKKFPYDYYTKYPFGVLHADLFDVFSVPSTRYYNLGQLEEWFAQSGMEVLEGRHCVSGWTVYGKKRSADE
ncbi:MAG: methyltransferase domain-containing protein [Nitrospiraceae bacterium]|nr:methyltransferase domain-containing protein [Nitrospiraceae bacterium]